MKQIPYIFPSIDITTIHDNIEDYTSKDIKFINEYKFHEKIEIEMEIVF